MYDELIYKPEEMVCDRIKDTDDAMLVCDAINAINALSKRRWIPVTERLPDAGERVLCYCRANISRRRQEVVPSRPRYEVMKMRTDGDWVYDTNHIYMRSFVTNWMPLPEPPKEG